METRVISDMQGLPFSEATPLLMDMISDGRVLYQAESKEFRFLQHTGYYFSSTNKYIVIPHKLQRFLRLKYTTEADKDLGAVYEQYFDEFLTWLIDNLVHFLPFDLSDIRFSGRNISGQPAPFMKLLTLLQQEKLLDQAFSHVLRFTHVRDAFEYEETSFENVHTLDGRVLESIFGESADWCEQQNGIWSQHYKRYNPQRILQPQHYFDYDNPENRFLKFLLRDIVTLCNTLIARYKQYVYITNKLVGIKSKCSAFLANALFETVGDMVLFPDNSQVLMKKDGYRDLFYLYLLLNTAIGNHVGSDADKAISMKDMATLWEYYIFVRLMKVLRGQFGHEVKAIYKPHVNGYYGFYDKATIQFKSGECLEYQHSSSSYSGLSWRPDFVFRTGERSIILDAKFRIFENNTDDLMKNMHYYKDGLNADMAVALSFGDEEKGCLFREEKNFPKVNFNILQEILQTKERGVGYFSLKPELL